MSNLQTRFENYVKKQIKYSLVQDKVITEKDNISIHFIETKEERLNNLKTCHYDTAKQSVVYEVTEYKKIFIVNYCRKDVDKNIF